MKRIVIIGATSGIGRALAELYLERGALVGGCGRQTNVLNAMEKARPQRFFGQKLDICDLNAIPVHLQALIERMGGMDICIVSSGISARNQELEWSIEADVLNTNVMGYARVLIEAARYFRMQKSGHLVGITSVAQYFGHINPAYNATKAFGAIYLQGLYHALSDKAIYVSEIVPGFVDTPLIGNSKKVFLVVPVKKAARHIVKAIDRRKARAYIPKRWLLVRWLIPFIPRVIMRKALKTARQ